uniref:Uncharacterized protein n=1 Tax=Vespula pensylvanica TaxID=30213 RepID=A0A834NSB8_VESPE|nr:hypothetical protein H0235_011581 [Vespula pensylvanica]
MVVKYQRQEIKRRHAASCLNGSPVSHSSCHREQLSGSQREYRELFSWWIISDVTRTPRIGALEARRRQYGCLHSIESR